MTTITALDEVLSGADVRPDDAPGAAAAALWDRIEGTYGLRVDSPVAALGVLDRVVLVLLDVVQLADWDAASLLNTDVETIQHAHEQARARIGLPPLDTPPCPRWDLIRAAHRIGDPDVVDALVAHLADCETCRHEPAEHSHARRRWARRATVASAPALGGVFTVIPALAVALALAAAVAAGTMAVRQARAGVTSPADLPVPIVVDDDPGLPSDEEPLEGWPTPTGELADDPASPAAGDVDADGDGVVDDVTDVVDDVTGEVTDTVGDVTDTVDDLVDDVTDTVDDVTDTIDDVTGEATDGVTDTVEDVTSGVDDLLP